MLRVDVCVYCRTRVAAIEGHPCGQFSYPTIQHVPEGDRIFVAYTVLFLPAKMPKECKVSCRTGSGNQYEIMASERQVLDEANLTISASGIVGVLRVLAP